MGASRRGCAGEGRRGPIPRALAVALWLALWQIASLIVGSGLLLPGPIEVATALARLVGTPGFWGALAESGARIVAGTAAGYAVALALAAASSASGAIRSLLEPPLAAIKGAPLACIVVLLLIWFGSEGVSGVAVFLVVAPAIYFPVLEGLDGRDPRMAELFRAYGAHALVKILAIDWPAVLPHLAAASRTVLGMAWKAGIATELIGTPAGTVGERVYQAKLLLETADLFAWTIAAIAISWALERLAIASLDASWPAAARLAARMSPGPRRPTNAPMTGGGTDGQAICVAGPSGAGKTTWLRRRAGLPTHLDGTSADAACPPPPEAARAAWLFQDSRLLEELTAVENAALLDGAGRGDGARAIMVELGLGECLDRPVSELSGGQRRRVELARALAAPLDPLVLDEPLAGLDPEARREAIDVAIRHAQGRLVLASAHDPAIARSLGIEVLEIS